MVQHKKQVLDKWQKIIEEYNCSGLRPGEFCRKKQINNNTFYAWRYRINGPREATIHNSFLELTPKELPPVKPSSSKVSSIQIVFNDMLKITIEDDFNESILLKVINVFGKVVC